MSSLLLFGLGSGLSGRRWRLRLPVRILSVQSNGPLARAAVAAVQFAARKSCEGLDIWNVDRTGRCVGSTRACYSQKILSLSYKGQRECALCAKSWSFRQWPLSDEFD
ncbi:hypothetical protein EVAR_26995_1 [Eumeta japonica]|uniref:Uncharacterized protein n=1 Tax=Eumeta variegata TaxID=151549 RepID=A0A4C1VKP5_EUMVA|nr:hypothetical protein EVAR_26995_1 [Eumeta japonica]